MAAKLFVAHTFHSILIKLIAAEIVSAHGLASGKSLVIELEIKSKDDDLLKQFKDDIEEGGYFNAVGLKGFIEEVIFSWWLDACEGSPSIKKSISDALRATLVSLCRYRFDSLPTSGKTRDVIRDFYHDIVPEQLRKSLGEFYTPDWLVDHTMDRAGFSPKDWLNLRVLDPTCGSGSFLLEAISRKRAAAENVNMNAADTLKMLISSVWGFDLNPLAVQSARVNFLMAIADLLEQCDAIEVEIPVLLADAVYSPAPDPDGDQKVVNYGIGSKQANLQVTLPSELAMDRVALDRVFEIMGEQVENNNEYDETEKILLKNNAIPKEKASEWREPLKKTYDQVLDLHRKEWNGIWFRVVRNFFWSATAGRFDLVAGNPPWVRWSNLPKAYRDRVKERCLKYNIFSENGFHGGNELDISAMITYTTADKWLNKGGKLTFVITQTVFQSPSSQGFRRFRIDKSNTIVPLLVDDLKDLKPFPDAANKTSVVVFEKSDKDVVYPVPYNVWKGKPAKDITGKLKLRKGLPVLEKSIDPNLTKHAVLAKIIQTQCEAWPVNDEPSSGAPWSVMPPGRHAKIKGLFGESTWVNGRKGITTDLNGVFFVGIHGQNKENNTVLIETRPQEGKTKLGDAKKFHVEPDLLYPLIKGAADFESCFLRPKEELFAFVPNRGIKESDFIAAKSKMTGLPKTKKFFKAHDSFLINRSTYKTRMAESAPSYSIYNVGDYTFSPFKVIWPEMSSTFCAAVAGSSSVPLIKGLRPFVPDHKIFFVDFATEEPAYFLCGLLNAPVVREMVHAHLISTQMGDIFKHINLPPYDSKNQEHIDLVTFVRKAHQELDDTKRKVIVSKVEAMSDSILANTLTERILTHPQSKAPKI